MELVSEINPLNTYLVIMDDGTLCHVHAGSYALTFDNYWTFWAERRPDKSKSTPIVSIKARKVDAIANIHHYEGEVLLAHTKNDKSSTQLRRVSKDKKPSQKPKTSAI